MRDVANLSGKHRPKRRHHGEGSRPFRVKDNRQRPWRCALRLGRDPMTGKLRQKWFSGTSAVDVERQRDEYVKRLRLAGSPEAAEQTVAAYLRRWLADRISDRDPSTGERYTGAVEGHLIPTLGPLLVAEVTHDHVMAARADWRSLKTGKPLSASSHNLTLGILREAMQSAVRRGLVAHDPTAEVDRLRLPASSARYLDVDEARTLLAALEGDYLEPIVKVALAVGPRRGEILGMRWQDVNLSSGEWTMARQLRRIPPASRHEGEGPYRLVRLKAEHATGRVLILPSYAVDALREHRTEWERMRAASKLWVQPGDLVFCDELGAAIPPNSVTRRFGMLAERAGLGHLRLHDLRHSTATMLLAMGVSERVVQEILGHATPRQTAHYMKVVKRLGRDAADRMDEAMVAGMVAENR